MFSVKEYLKSDYKDTSTELNIGNETFLVRRMDGLERLEFADMPQGKARIIFTLAHCLIDGETKRPIGEASAKKLIKMEDSLANEIAMRIYNFTTDSLKAEEERWGIAEKNSPETSSSGSIDSIAEDTV